MAVLLYSLCVLDSVNSWKLIMTAGLNDNGERKGLTLWCYIKHEKKIQGLQGVKISFGFFFSAVNGCIIGDLWKLTFISWILEWFQQWIYDIPEDHQARLWISRRLPAKSKGSCL